ncbi:MAG TPA: hypothetical protein VGL93_13425 [Streptosporangiaceae bacterium]|jgi:hypothetical protein
MTVRRALTRAGVVAIVAALAALGTVAGLARGCGPVGGGRTAAPKPSGLTAARLADALVFTYGPYGSITQPAAGAYRSLPTAASAGGVAGAPANTKFDPADCAKAIWSGPDPARFGTAQAAVTALRRAGDTSSSGTQIWNELIAAPGATARAALGTGPLPGCARVRGSYQGRSLEFTEEKAPRLGTAARAASVTSGGRSVRVVAFADRGYVGVVLAQGLSRTKTAAFAAQVYATAHAKLG